MEVFSRKGDPIASLLDWERFGKPTAEHHWVEGRSAYELARDWIEAGAADRVTRLLTLRPELSGLVLDKVIVEKQTYFDDQGRGPRNHDLLIEATCHAGPAPLRQAIDHEAALVLRQTQINWTRQLIGIHTRHKRSLRRTRRYGSFVQQPPCIAARLLCGEADPPPGCIHRRRHG
jgi:hypothetical protein